MQSQDDVTALLAAAAAGDSDAGDRVYELLYAELRRLARRQLRRVGRHTLDSTELVHEAYVKLARGHDVEWANRRHFLCLTARAMRQVLVDHARERLRYKRGGGARPETLDEQSLIEHTQLERVLAVDEAMVSLGRTDDRMAPVVECKFFAGLTEPETAVALGLSERTVRRLWHAAREQLRVELGAV